MLNTIVCGIDVVPTEMDVDCAWTFARTSPVCRKKKKKRALRESPLEVREFAWLG